jgi:hypothetical protein
MHCKAKGSVVEVNLMPLNSRTASKHYADAVEFMFENKGRAFDAWSSNKIKFIIEKHKSNGKQSNTYWKPG